MYAMPAGSSLAASAGVRRLFQSRPQTRSRAITLQAGASAGSKVKWELPQAEMNTPDLSGDSVWRDIAVDLVGLPTSAMEDEIR